MDARMSATRGFFSGPTSAKGKKARMSREIDSMAAQMVGLSSAEEFSAVIRRHVWYVELLERNIRKSLRDADKRCQDRRQNALR